MTQTNSTNKTVGVVVIGRNEGERLIKCLKSVIEPGCRVVYVDSASSDGSVGAARDLGADVVELDMSVPFTAARARNAGVARLSDQGAPEFIQFVDGDCEVMDGWINQAVAHLKGNPKVAVVCGRRREAHPERTIFNRLVDREWETPVGEADACGGDALMRYDAFQSVDGFNEGLIAGEEPELCLRLRAAGWRIHRIDAEMTRHDIAMTSLGQWLKRARRAGHAFAEVSRMHRDKPERIWAREALRALLWSGLMGLGFFGLFVFPPLALLLLLLPLQIMRIAQRETGLGSARWTYASLIMLQKPWEAAGAIQYWLGGSKIIEY